jgi:hypothetical protein
VSLKLSRYKVTEFSKVSSKYPIFAKISKF